MTAPSCLDRHLECRVQGISLARYKKAAFTFYSWAVRNSHEPVTAEDWDDALMIFKRSGGPDGSPLKRTAFEGTIAAVEFFFPRFKGKLLYCREALKGWAIAYTPRHTVPMTRGPACLIGVHMSSLGHPRMGGAIILQQRLGLRPSELLQLQTQDFSLPEEQGLDPISSPIVIGLGMRSGTKAKRVQSVLLSPISDPDLCSFIRRILVATPADREVFGYTYEQYRRLLKVCEARLCQDFGFTPHSPRSGFASEGRALGKSFTELKEQGRWVSDASFRVYIDVVAAAQINVSLKAAHLAPALAWATQHWGDYTSAALLASYPSRRYARKRE